MVRTENPAQAEATPCMRSGPHLRTLLQRGLEQRTDRAASTVPATCLSSGLSFLCASLTLGYTRRSHNGSLRMDNRAELKREVKDCSEHRGCWSCHRGADFRDSPKMGSGFLGRGLRILLPGKCSPSRGRTAGLGSY